MKIRLAMLLIGVLGSADAQAQTVLEQRWIQASPAQVQELERTIEEMKKDSEPDETVKGEGPR